MICADAGAEIKLQCSGEYGFGDMDEEDPRATQLYKFTKAELKICQLTTKMSQKMWQNFITLQLQLDLEIKKSLLKVFVIILFYFNHLNQ